MRYVKANQIRCLLIAFLCCLYSCQNTFKIAQPHTDSLELTKTNTTQSTTRSHKKTKTNQKELPAQLQALKSLSTHPQKLVHALDQYSVQQLNQWLPLLSKDELIATLIYHRKAKDRAHRSSHLTAASYAYQGLIAQASTTHATITTPLIPSVIQNAQHSKPFHIAVLLPLSGRYAKPGQKVQAEFKKLQHFFPEFKIIYLDTQGDRDYAVHAFKQAVHTHQVQLVIGPLGYWESQAVAPLIEWYEIPWFPLSTDPHFARGTFTFQVRFTPDLESQEIANAVCGSDIKSVAILYPQHKYGKQLAKSTTQQLKRCGVQIKQSIQLNPRRLQESLIALSGRKKPYKKDQWWARLNRKRKHPALQTAPHVNYEALLVLLRGKRLTQVVSQLEWWDIELKRHPDQDIGKLHYKYNGVLPNRVRLFTGLGSIGAAQSVVTPQSFDYAYMLSLPPLSQIGEDFVRTYQKNYRRHPSRFSQELYDAFLWLREAFADPIKTRKDLRINLLNFSVMNGVFGVRSVSSRGLSLPKIIPMTRAQDYGVVEIDQVSWSELNVPE